MIALKVLLNSLSLGGTEKAACLWAATLHNFGLNVSAISLADGPRRSDLDRFGVPLTIATPLSDNDKAIHLLADLLSVADVIHSHVPGYPHQGDILGKALKLLPRKIPVIQTNVFGKLENPAEDDWTDFRLFISWTSCVQAARRAGKKLDLDFFRRQSVAVYPVEDPYRDGKEGQESKLTLEKAAEELRSLLGLNEEHILYGRFSRPEPNKWSPIVLEAFLAAYKRNPNIRLLLREPPAAVTSGILNDGLGMVYDSAIENSKFKIQNFPILIFPATSDPYELKVSQLACDVILHTSSIGESFGYGLAEPMALGRPVITNSVPWHDQAQIELVRHGECGLIASTVSSMEAAILRMAESSKWRVKCGESAREHILKVADPAESTDRIKMAMKCAIERIDNPLMEQDLEKALKTAEYLDKNQWGHSAGDVIHLRTFDAKVRFLRWQRKLRSGWKYNNY